MYSRDIERDTLREKIGTRLFWRLSYGTRLFCFRQIRMDSMALCMAQNISVRCWYLWHMSVLVAKTHRMIGSVSDDYCFSKNLVLVGYIGSTTTLANSEMPSFSKWITIRAETQNMIYGILCIMDITCVWLVGARIGWRQNFRVLFHKSLI